MKVEKDYEELLQLFNKHSVKYCIVGSYALAFYARPRYTKDMDIMVGHSLENARRILTALREFGFSSLQLSEHDFTEPGQILDYSYQFSNRNSLKQIKSALLFVTRIRSLTLAIDAI